MPGGPSQIKKVEPIHNFSDHVQTPSSSSSDEVEETEKLDSDDESDKARGKNPGRDNRAEDSSMMSRAPSRSLPISRNDGEVGVPEEGMMVLLLLHCQALEKHLERNGRCTERGKRSFYIKGKKHLGKHWQGILEEFHSKRISTGEKERD